MTYHKLSDQQATSLVRITVWWKDELLKKGKVPEDDKRLDWMMKILTKKRYNDNAKQFLNQMREMYLGIETKNEKKESKPFRSTVNVGGFPMI